MDTNTAKTYALGVNGERRRAPRAARSLRLALLLCCGLAAGPAWAQGDGDAGDPDNDPIGDSSADIDSDSDADPPVGASSADGSMDDDSLGGGLGGGLDGGTEGNRPWADGVSLEDQQRARELFKEANALIRQTLIPDAIEKYREALSYWEHPGIYYNLSFALHDQKQIVEAYRSLERAIAYGPDPIGAPRVARAEERMELLRGQLGTIEISCAQDDVQVALDGRTVLTCPGSYTKLAPVGEYRVLATKDKYLTGDYQVVLSPEETEALLIELEAIGDGTITKRRWERAWVPWAVAGAGAVLLVGGGVLHNSARTGFASYDEDFDGLCGSGDSGEPGGCKDSEVPQLTERRESATNRQRIAFVTYALGGAALTAGLTLAYLNRSRVFRRDDPTKEITFVPILAPESIGVSAAMRF
ncbi:MAG: hypothetical protein Tsb0020_04270 [Haliangiales bacterium]